MGGGGPSEPYYDEPGYPNQGEGGGGGPPPFDPQEGGPGSSQPPAPNVSPQLDPQIKDFILAQIEEEIKRQRERAEIEKATIFRDESRSRQRALAGLQSGSRTPSRSGTIIGGPQVGAVTSTGGSILGSSGGYTGNQRKALGR